MQYFKTFSTACLLVIGLTLSTHAQFLKVSGKKIVDDSNNEILFRGMGLGGWMLQEGYMMETANFANTQHDIRSRIQDLIGATNTDQFYNAWLSNHFTKQDVDSLAHWGFNSIRLPMHYNLFTLSIQQEPVQGANTWVDKGFVMIDSLIKWCAANKIYVILDLHAAPGGQGRDISISDGNPSLPSLWESTDNRNKTIALWTKLAQRYANEPWVGGYDLLNEPNWNFTAGKNQNGCDETANTPLWQIYKDITAAIRTVDTKHIIFCEGNCWANNYAGFYTWDNNQVVSFHKYWSNNDVSSIQNALNLRTQFNVPLWLGESGENSNQWFKDAITLVENNNIGWAWWPLKKIKSIVDPLTVKEEPDYRTLLNYWQSGGTQPTVAFATNALMKQAENLKISNNIFHKDVIDAMFRQRNTNSTIPFSNNSIPGKINSTDFDLGSNGYAYYDLDVADYHVSTNVTTVWNQGNSYRNDGVDIEATQDTSKVSNGYDVSWIQDGEWMQYTSQIDSLAGYTIGIRYAAAYATSKLKIMANDQIIVPSTILPSTGGAQKWSTYNFQNVIIPKGAQKIKVVIDKGGMNLGFMNFSISSKSSDLPFNVVAGETSPSTPNVMVSLNKSIDPATLALDSLICTVNRSQVTIKNLAVSGANNFQFSFDIDQKVTDADTIKVSYTGTKIKSTDGTSLSSFTDLVIKNNLPIHVAVPGTIQAESYTVNNGMVPEGCSDLGLGLDMGYCDPGDYLDYNIRVARTGSYTIEVRSACYGSVGTVQVQQLDDDGVNVLNSVNIDLPVTGGWQTWGSTTSKINLTAGPSRLRVKIVQSGMNLNWYKFTSNLIDAIEPLGKFSLYPNPAKKFVTLQVPPELQNADKKFLIYNTLGQNVKSPVAKESYNGDISISLDGLTPGLYILILQSELGMWQFKTVIE
ncbi:MAG: carbohydrate-binding protein [Cyclobacteriaceae bacterium]